jgi:hypothetical protein
MMCDEQRGENSELWFCAKMIFSWYQRATGKRICYEERFVLVRARDLDRAIVKAEQEAQAYCADFGPDWSAKYESFCRVYEMLDVVPGDGAEVYAETHESPLEPIEYITRHHVGEAGTDENAEAR